MANEVKWIKITTDMFDNRKIRHLRRLPDGNNIVLIWVMLLTMAGRCNSGGMIFLTENIPYTPKMLADELDFEESTVLLALEALERLEMIVTDHGFFVIAGWEEHQNIDGMERLKEQKRLAQKRYREKQKALTSSVGDITEISRVISRDNTEEDKEKDEEKDEEKEKEYHSFNQSAFSGDDFQENVDNSVDKERAKRQFLGGSLGKGVVLLSQEQMDNLLDVLSAEEFDHYVSVIAEKELQGHHYKRKTHYQAIMDMAKQDRKI